MGLSTRQVSCFFYRQLKDSISPGVVSRLLRELDEEHSRWQHRALGSYPYLVVAGLWIKVMVGGGDSKGRFSLPWVQGRILRGRYWPSV